MARTCEPPSKREAPWQRRHNYITATTRSELGSANDPRGSTPQRSVISSAHAIRLNRVAPPHKRIRTADIVRRIFHECSIVRRTFDFVTTRRTVRRNAIGDAPSLLRHRTLDAARRRHPPTSASPRGSGVPPTANRCAAAAVSSSVATHTVAPAAVSWAAMAMAMATAAALRATMPPAWGVRRTHVAYKLVSLPLNTRVLARVSLEPRRRQRHRRRHRRRSTHRHARVSLEPRRRVAREYRRRRSVAAAAAAVGRQSRRRRVFAVRSAVALDHWRRRRRARREVDIGRVEHLGDKCEWKRSNFMLVHASTTSSSSNTAKRSNRHSNMELYSDARRLRLSDKNVLSSPIRVSTANSVRHLEFATSSPCRFAEWGASGPPESSVILKTIRVRRLQIERNLILVSDKQNTFMT